MYGQLTTGLHWQVLTTGYWPTQQAAQCRMPPEVEALCVVFKRFYLAQYNGRQLRSHSPPLASDSDDQ